MSISEDNRLSAFILYINSLREQGINYYRNDYNKIKIAKYSKLHNYAIGNFIF